MTEEERAAVEYAHDVFEARAKSTSVSLWCDYALLWMKKVAGRTMTQEETERLDNFLPPKWRTP